MLQDEIIVKTCTNGKIVRVCIRPHNFLPQACTLTLMLGMEVKLEIIYVQESLIEPAKKTLCAIGAEL
jgi:hypothetical protein